MEKRISRLASFQMGNWSKPLPPALFAHAQPRTMTRSLMPKRSTMTKPRRNPWPIAIIAYFAVFISFIVTFIVWASHQRVDLVRADYYEAEIKFQQQIDRVERSRPVE